MAINSALELDELMPAEDMLAHGVLIAPAARGAGNFGVGVRCGRRFLSRTWLYCAD
jgi:hypothetical protein